LGEDSTLALDWLPILPAKRSKPDSLELEATALESLGHTVTLQEAA
jgi:hypothetical protein